MDLNSCILQIQSYLEKSPLVILGSGSSAAYGLPTMSELCDELLAHADDFDPNDETVKDFFFNLRSGLGLETAVGMAYQLGIKEKELIRKIVWQKVNNSNNAFFMKAISTDFADFSLISLLQKILAPSPNKADIITTNYDKLAEYAADWIGASVITGYEGTYYRKMEIPSQHLTSKRIKARERLVSIWKVHGSLDWFLSPSGKQCALPECITFPNEYIPNIVPPGNDKFQTTHQDPYRTIMTQADNAIVNAQCYLAIGYGFNDEHIQPKIIEEIKKGKPIVVITKKATDACKNVLAQSDVQKYMIIEEDNNQTLVTSKDWYATYDEKFWSLDGFIKKW